jgi:hypothetical protein
LGIAKQPKANKYNLSDPEGVTSLTLSFASSGLTPYLWIFCGLSFVPQLAPTVIEILPFLGTMKGEQGRVGRYWEYRSAKAIMS